MFWNECELDPGVLDISVLDFIELARKIGFVVILRPDPYVCGEHEYGGLPWWLLNGKSTVTISRTKDTGYFNAVTRWFDILLPALVPYLYKNGGPIIMIQVRFVRSQFN